MPLPIARIIGRHGKLGSARRSRDAIRSLHEGDIEERSDRGCMPLPIARIIGRHGKLGSARRSRDAIGGLEKRYWEDITNRRGTRLSIVRVVDLALHGATSLT